jgi:hypothetical protein
MPVITGGTGIVTKGLKNNLEVIPGKHSVDWLQTTAILRTSHIIRKALQSETWGPNGGDHRWFKRSTEKKRSARRDIIITVTVTVTVIITFDVKPTITVVYILIIYILRSYNRLLPFLWILTLLPYLQWFT